MGICSMSQGTQTGGLNQLREWDGERDGREVPGRAYMCTYG